MNRKSQGFVSIFTLIVVSLLFIVISSLLSSAVTQSKINKNSLTYIQAVNIGESKIQVANSPQYREKYLDPFLKNYNNIPMGYSIEYSINPQDLIFGETNNKIKIVKKSNEYYTVACETEYRNLHLFTYAKYSFISIGEVPQNVNEEHSFNSRIADIVQGTDTFVDNTSIFSTTNDIVVTQNESHLSIFNSADYEAIENSNIEEPVVVDETTLNDEPINSESTMPTDEGIAEDALIGESLDNEPVIQNSFPTAQYKQNLEDPAYLKLMGKTTFESDEPIQLQGVVILSGEVTLETSLVIDGILVLVKPILKIVNESSLEVRGYVVMDEDLSDFLVIQRDNDNFLKYVNALNLRKEVSQIELITSDGIILER